ncbi:hypothetical protein IAD21_06447 (plasmid) [Abditibacteriota bacterium]|nr:hypothetical protein IAD21_06447 [Abditibacteriota bacterium]
MAKITEADCRLNCLSVAIVEGRYVFPIQGEIENLALWTGQGRDIYFQTTWLDRNKGIGLRYNEELEAWELVTRDENGP